METVNDEQVHLVDGSRPPSLEEYSVHRSYPRQRCQGAVVFLVDLLPARRTRAEGTGRRSPHSSSWSWSHLTGPHPGEETDSVHILLYTVYLSSLLSSRVEYP